MKIETGQEIEYEVSEQFDIVFDDFDELLPPDASLEAKEDAEEPLITSQEYIENEDGFYLYDEEAGIDTTLQLVLNPYQEETLQAALLVGAATAEILTEFGTEDEEVWSVQTFSLSRQLPDGSRVITLRAVTETRPKLPKEDAEELNTLDVDATMPETLIYGDSIEEPGETAPEAPPPTALSLEAYCVIPVIQPLEEHPSAQITSPRPMQHIRPAITLEPKPVLHPEHGAENDSPSLDISTKGETAVLHDDLVPIEIPEIVKECPQESIETVTASQIQAWPVDKVVNHVAEIPATIQASHVESEIVDLEAMTPHVESSLIIEAPAKIELEVELEETHDILPASAVKDRKPKIIQPDEIVFIREVTKDTPRAVMLDAKQIIVHTAQSAPATRDINIAILTNVRPEQSERTSKDTRSRAPELKIVKDKKYEEPATAPHANRETSRAMSSACVIASKSTVIHPRRLGERLETPAWERVGNGHNFTAAAFTPWSSNDITSSSHPDEIIISFASHNGGRRIRSASVKSLAA